MHYFIKFVYLKSKVKSMSKHCSIVETALEKTLKKYTSFNQQQFINSFSSLVGSEEVVGVN